MVRVYSPRERMTITGRLMNIQAKPEDEIEEGAVYRKLTIQLGTGSGREYISAFNRDGIDITGIPELYRADQMLLADQHPMVSVRYYENYSDKTGKTYKNATLRDLEEGFELLG